MEAYLKDSYKICADITKSQAKNFYYAFVTLPKHKRMAIYAVYAFCRYCDDISDDKETENRSDQFVNLKRELKLSVDGKFTNDPIIPALIDTINKFEIPISYFHELINGVEMDLTKSRFLNFNELKDYCYKVASIVGLISINIFGYKNSKASQYAIDLGIAMQLTNIMRDLSEDSERNRIYIPQDEMNQYGYKEADMLNGQVNDNFKQLMHFQVKRARCYFDSGINLLEFLDKDARGCTAILHNLYSRILDKIEEEEYEVFSSRISLTRIEKTTIMTKFFFISIINKLNITSR
ncbi:MAG: phytoene synthase [Chloroflexi bacterium]|nr:MAG: phytoene synthase [Chloroflexota bacterium]